MSVNGIGGGQNSNAFQTMECMHDHSAHHVTECVHEHSAQEKRSGGASVSSDNSVLQVQSSVYVQPEGQLTLASWMKKTLGSGKRLLLKIWGGNSDDTAGAVNAETLSAAATSLAPQQRTEKNPYFSAIEDTGRERQNIWEKIKVKFRDVAAQLMGRFSSQNSFQTKQEKPKEDLRKHSRYREDDLEIDCILTDDSYLMDSYDRKGEYSKLSTKK